MMALADDFVPDELWTLVEPCYRSCRPGMTADRTIVDRNCVAAQVAEDDLTASWRY
jgi:hypothetical protein